MMDVKGASALPPDQDGGKARYRLPVVLTHLAILILTCWIVLGNNRALLFFGYDGAFHKTNIQAQHQWTSRVPWFEYNPLQAFGNEFFHVNTRWSPSLSLAVTVGKGVTRPVIAYSILAIETFLSVLLLCWSFRVRPLVGFLAAWTLTLIALPFVFPVHFYPIYGVGPQFIEFIAVQTVMIGLFHRIGQHRRVTSVALGSGVYGLGLWSVICCPTNILLQAPLLAFFFLVSFLSSTARAERWAKGLAVAVMLCVSLPTVVPYFAGTYLYSVPTFFSGELQNDRMQFFWVSILFHGRSLGQWFGPVLVVTSAAGSVLACFAAAGAVRNLAVGTLAASSLVIGGGLALTFLLPRYAGPSPLYWEFFLWPLHCLCFAFLVITLPSAVLRWVLGRKVPAFVGWPVLRLTAAFQIPLLLLPAVVIAWSFHDGGKSAYCQFRFPPVRTELIRTLQEEIGLRPGSAYRGAAATFTGYVGKPGSATWFSILDADFQGEAKAGNDYRNMGLWYFGIPTLFEYNTLMTPSYYLLMSRMLARPEDKQLRVVIILTRPHLNYLRSLGVRFLITDFPLSGVGVRQRGAQQLPGTRLTFYLSELDEPNLATYSPTKITVSDSAADILARLRRDDFDFRAEAVADRALPNNLVKAQTVRLTFEKDRLVVEGTSSGTSVLLLPLQFSHCLHLTELAPAAGSDRPQLLRLNLMQTGLLFSGSVRAAIRFAYGPFHSPYGRIWDYMDMKKLNISGASY
jgi:hypothetical protein